MVRWTRLEVVSNSIIFMDFVQGNLSNFITFKDIVTYIYRCELNVLL